MNSNAQYRVMTPKELMATQISKDILIVDDDCDHRLVLTDLLQSHGYTTVTAENGSEALAKLSTQFVSLVVTDFLMPGMNGLELIRNMATRHLLEKTPVILMTGTHRVHLEELARSAGALATVFKPYDIKRLLTLISAAIGQPALT